MRHADGMTEQPETSSTLATPMEQRWQREDRRGSDDAWDALARVALLAGGIAFLLGVAVWAAYLFNGASR